jgi:hypothetical protein
LWKFRDKEEDPKPRGLDGFKIGDGPRLGKRVTILPS